MTYPLYLWLSLSTPEIFPNRVTWNGAKKAGKQFVMLKMLRSDWEKGKTTCMISRDFCKLGDKP